MMAAQPVPFYNPLDPAAALQASDIQRRQKLAEQLMQGGQQQEGTQMAGNIAIPVSPFAALAKALQTTAGGYFEGKANRDALALQQQQYASLLAGATGQSPQGVGAANSQAGSIPGTSSGTGAVPGGGLNPQAAAMALALGGPEGLGTMYRESYLAHTNPTDMMKNDNWQGIAPNQQRALTMSEAAKNVGVSGGQPNFDSQGNMTISPIPGAADTQAGFTAAQEGAKAQYGAPVPVTGPDGQTKLVRPDIMAAALGQVSPQNPGMNLPGATQQQAAPLQSSPGSALPAMPPVAPPVQAGPPGIPVQNPEQLKTQQGAIAAKNLFEKLSNNLDAMDQIAPDVPTDSNFVPAKFKAYMSQNAGNIPLIGDHQKAANAAHMWDQLNPQQIVASLQQLVSSGAIRSNKALVSLLSQSSAIPMNASIEAKKNMISALRNELKNAMTSTLNINADTSGGQPSSYIPVLSSPQNPMDAIDAELKRRGVQ